MSKIYFISSHKKDVYDSQIGAIMKSRYYYLFILVNFSDDIEINRENIYFISCLLLSKEAKYFLDLKKKGDIKYLVVHCTGNVDFISKDVLDLYDLIFYETDYSYRLSYLNQHSNINVKAFGIDTEIFNDKNKEINKEYDYIWVGSINESLKKFMGVKELCEKNSKILFVGDIYTDKDRELLHYLENDYRIYFHKRCDLYTLKNLYSKSKCCVLTQPEYGGGERCLLESKYMGLEIKILSNRKLEDLNRDVQIYDLNYFASKIDEGLEKLFLKIKKNS